VDLKYNILPTVFLYTSSSLFVLFNVIMVMNLAILKTAPSFSNTAFYFVFIALTPHLKMAKKNIRFALEMT
jgi:hypothetical protein